MRFHLDKPIELARQATVPCGALEGAACAQFQDQMEELGSQLFVARRMIAAVGPLAELNSKLLLPEDEAVDPATLPKLDMSFLSLNLLDDEAFMPGGAAAGSAAAELQTQRRRAATLLRTKMEQMRAFGQAALEKHGHEQLAALQASAAARGEEVVAAELDEAKQLAVAQDVLGAKIQTYNYLGLEYLVSGIRAFEYIFLTKYDGLDLAGLRAAEQTPEAYQDFVQQGSADLQVATRQRARSHGAVGWAPALARVRHLTLVRCRCCPAGRVHG
jgi:hypothetical protein